MDDDAPTQRGRQLALLVSGLLDMLLGAGLVLVWLGVLPVDLARFDLPHWVIAAVGMLLFISGTAVVTYQATRLRP